VPVLLGLEGQDNGYGTQEEEQIGSLLSANGIKQLAYYKISAQAKGVCQSHNQADLVGTPSQIVYYMIGKEIHGRG
jgi:hypothetical protein